MSPLRRLIALLCGVLMMHTSWMAATASCASATAARVATEESAPSSAHQHHHGAPAPADAPPTQQNTTSHDAPPPGCPMAMACTLSAVITNVPTVAVQTVAFTAAVPTHVADAPRSTASAPEPPPPRA